MQEIFMNDYYYYLNIFFIVEFKNENQYIGVNKQNQQVVGTKILTKLKRKY